LSWSRPLLVAACLLTAPRAIWAQVSPPPEVPSELDRAREAFVLGLALSRAEQWPDALAAFERSAKLKTHPVTTYNIAYCERALGRHASAYWHFSLALATTESDRLPPAYADEARGYLTEAEHRVAHAQLSLLTPGLELRVDDRPIVALAAVDGRTVYLVGESDDTAAGNLPAAFELWLDPGSHIFSARGPGTAKVVQTHRVAAGVSLALTLGSKAAAGPSPPRIPPRKPPAAPSQPPDRRAALSLLGVGVGGFVASAVFAATALDDKQKLDQNRCPNHVCPTRYYADEDHMKTFANAATVSFVVGALAVGAGSYLYFGAKAKSVGLELRGRIGLGSLGAVGAF
jgi:hypothetical protein